jgi:ankyrin repeat protein
MEYCELPLNNYQNMKRVSRNIYTQDPILNEFRDAISNNDLNAINKLINADPNRRDDTLSMLKIAVLLNKEAVVHLILLNEKFILKDADILAIACSLNAEEIVHDLCHLKDINVNKQGGTENEFPLIYAIRNNNMPIFNSLMKRKDIDVNTVSTTSNICAYLIALFNKNYAMCSALLSHLGFDITVTYSNYDLLYHTVKFGDSALIKQLLNHKNFDIKYFKKYLDEAFSMCKINDLELMNMFLKYANINYQDLYGNTVLMNNSDNVENMEILLNQKDIDMCAVNKRTNLNVLFTSIEDKKERSIDLLLQHALKKNVVTNLINHTNNNGENALMVALRTNQNSLATRLINMGCDINISDNTGYTPLIKVILGADYKLFDILLSRSELDFNKSDHNGVTPLMYAYDIMCSGYSTKRETFKTIDGVRQNPSYFFYTLLENSKTDVNKVNCHGQSLLTLVLLGKDIVPSARKSQTLGGREEGMMSAAYPQCFQTAMYNLGGCCIENSSNNSTIIDKVSVLLNNDRVDANITDNDGQTPLMYICQNANIELFNVFVANPKVDVKITDRNGKNLLMYLADQMIGKESKNSIIPAIHKPEKMEMDCEFNKFEIQMPYYAKDPSSNKITNDTDTTLLYMFDRLLNHKDSNLNYKDYEGNTLLMQLCKNHQYALINKVVGKNVDLNASNYKNETAILIAIRNKSWALVEKLLKMGATYEPGTVTDMSSRSILEKLVEKNTNKKTGGWLFA